jgi:hypothetical protein
MTQSQPQTTSLFRNSLRDWQARWKAMRASEQPTPTAAESNPPRVKRLVAHKRRKMRLAVSV